MTRLRTTPFFTPLLLPDAPITPADRARAIRKYDAEEPMSLRDWLALADFMDESELKPAEVDA